MAYRGQRIGYIRVSSFDQDAGRQLESVEVERVFTDKASCRGATRSIPLSDNLR